MVLWEEFSALLPIYNLYPRINCQIRLSVTASLCNFPSTGINKIKEELTPSFSTYQAFFLASHGTSQSKAAAQVLIVRKKPSC